MDNCCADADLECYIGNLDKILDSLRINASQGTFPSIDEMVGLFLDGPDDPMLNCHWLAVNLALTMQKLVLPV